MNFPASPTIGQEYSIGERTWAFNGTGWALVKRVPMESVTGLTAALAGKQAAGSYATAAQGTKADSALQPADIGNTIQAYSAILNSTTASFTTALNTKLGNIAAGATANATDAQLRDRSTHTGAQAQSTITNLTTDLAAKAPLASPVFTGTPTAPTQAAGNNTTRLATTAFVAQAIANLIGSAPGALDTFQELANALGNDPNFATTITNSLSGKLTAANNLSDVVNASTALTNLGLTANGSALVKAANYAAMKTLLGLQNVSNTSDANKPVSTAMQTALDTKVNNTRIAISTADPSGGVNGDLWFKI